MEKCVYPSQLLQKLHRQHRPNSHLEVLRGHSSGARDVNWSRSRTLDILKPHYANLMVGAVGQSCFPVNQTYFVFLPNIVGNLVLCLVCVVSAILFLAPGDLHISCAFYLSWFGNDPPGLYMLGDNLTPSVFSCELKILMWFLEYTFCLLHTHKSLLMPICPTLPTPTWAKF